MSVRPKRTAINVAAVATAVACGLTPGPVARASPPSDEANASSTDQPPVGGSDESDRSTAKRLAQDGRTLFWKGEYRAAINAFESAYAVVPDPNLLFNISTAYEKLGDEQAALEYLDRYAQDAPEEEHPAIAAKRAELLEAADAETAPNDAQLADNAGPADPTVPAPAGATPPAPDPTDDPARAPVMNPLGWSLAGVSVAALGVGVGLGVSAGQLSREGESACADIGGSLRCPSSAENDLTRARRRALGADIAFGIAAAAGIATLAVIGVRVARRRKARREDARVRVSGVSGGFSVRF